MKKTVGIASLHTAVNYGVFLQAYALQEKIRSFGYDTQIINYDKRAEGDSKLSKKQKLIRFYSHVRNFSIIVERKNFRKIPESKRREREFKRFSNERFTFSPYCNNVDDVKKILSARYDAYVCGSDQIWNPTHTKMNPFYFLAFADNDKKIAYSPSVSCITIPEMYKKEFFEKVSDFHFISSREKTGSNLIEEGTGRKCPTVIDPTLLYEKRDYEKLSLNQRLIKEPYVLCYYLNFSELHKKAAEKISEELGIKVVVVPCDPRVYYELEGEKVFASIEEFLSLVRDAEFVLTDSFHGTAFSVIYRKNFRSIKNYGDEGKFTRINDFLSELGLQKCIATKDNVELLSADETDYSQAETKLDEWRAFSAEYLENALKTVVGDAQKKAEKENVSLFDKGDCYGCSECANVCPTDAIKMIPDEKTGYLYPEVDFEKCVNCKQCVSKCIIERKNQIRVAESDKSAYFVAKTKDKDVHLNSSSGGIFYPFAQEIINQNGYVCGAVYDEDFCGVHHVLTDKIEDVQAMRGSKYVQSDKRKVFSEIKQKLSEGKPVLFTGAPCEANALRVFLKNDYDNLFVMSYICHGPTAPYMLKEFTKKISSENGRVVGMNMRYKKDGKIFPLHLKADFEDGSFYCEDSFHSSFSRIFRSDIVMRPSCTKCEFKMLPQYGDILIGDKGKLDFENEDEAGNSVVFLFTDKAIELFNKIKDGIDVSDVPKEKMVLCSERLYSPAKPKKQATTEKFLKILKDEGIDKAADYALAIPSVKRKIRSGINAAAKKILKKFGV